MQEGYKTATEIPLKTVKYCCKSLNICERISKLMDDSMASDVGSGAHMAMSGAQAAAYNVKINLKSIKDESYVNQTNEKLELILSKCKELLNTISEKVEGTL